jgi:integrase
MGSLYQRKNKIWYAIFSIQGKVNSQWKSTGTKNKKLAQEILRHWENELEAGQAGIIKIRPLKFSDFGTEYLKWAVLNKRPNTVRLERGFIENHLKPFFGAWTLDRIEATDIERYKASRKTDPNHPVRSRSINLELTLLSLMLKKAVEWKNLRRLPVDKIAKLPETDSMQRRALNQAQVSRLLDAASGQSHLLVAMLAYTGARLSEVMFLEWADIDLDRSEISIHSKPEHGFNTKSGKSRVIPLHPELKAMLEAIPGKSGWLFKDESGKRIKTLRRGFEAACRRAELEWVSAHCLRHSFASLMIQNGADVKTLSEIMGHSNPVITLQVYAHCFDSQRRQAIARLPSFAPEAGELVHFPVAENSDLGKEPQQKG